MNTTKIDTVFDDLGNLLMNMSAGVLPENLCSDEIKLLEDKYGEDWFEKLSYFEPAYKKPAQGAKYEN